MEDPLATPVSGNSRDVFSEVPLSAGTPSLGDKTEKPPFSSNTASYSLSPIPPTPPEDLTMPLREPIATPPAQILPPKTTFFGFGVGVGIPATDPPLPSQSRAGSNSSQGWRSAVGNLFSTRSTSSTPASSLQPLVTPSMPTVSPNATPTSAAQAGPSRGALTSFLLHRIEDQAASRDRRISQEMGEGEKLREGFERVRAEMEDAARDMRRERQAKGIAGGEADDQAYQGEEGIDWAFWGAVVQDYEEVARTRPKELSRAIQQGIPAVIRGAIWQLMSSSKSAALEETYKKLLKETSPHEKAIAKDLSRTFPHHKYFQEGGGVGQESLFLVVKAYSLYDQEVGYTQGLAFIVAALLLNMPDEEAFCVLVRLMDSYNLRSHYLADMPGLQLRLFQFDRLIEDLLPLLHAHLLKKGVKSSMYASSWLLTLFANRFPLTLVYRVLDIIFAEGIEAIFRFSLALLQQSEDKLVQLEFENILTYLQSDLFEVYRVGEDEAHEGPDGDMLGEDEWRANDFVRDAYAVRITPFMLDSYEAEYNERLRSLNAHALELDMLRNANRNLSSQVKQLEVSLASSNQEHVELVRQLVMCKIEKEETESELVRYKMLYAELAHQQQDAMSVHSRLSNASLQAGQSGSRQGSTSA
ncbi:hypothetical protein TREMEDRAFT_33160 [Tremella mesenterica DSM 1558]|uniref:uncharacterized protein n=1 Tax=Tremella mesenterica (strain ATCC 24925 / CBS 8224 / DSM 1558 / NBRC 9311 / NRRL Y-6157 / RJB 2259-6 / UBC 559-6) TaxID=578456 RepID=UPI0003F4A131|nr:uncharacterized protein TREMEDRAFT_33160 [Tremella mesenterica DSM 1558]EIW67913.1 hypothetical protein TREMEDRAFT_33160 [Tremella mesenterica DSM 1558]